MLLGLGSSSVMRGLRCNSVADLIPPGIDDDLCKLNLLVTPDLVHVWDFVNADLDGLEKRLQILVRPKIQAVWG